jgi:hypothetical protein
MMIMRVQVLLLLIALFAKPFSDISPDMAVSKKEPTIQAQYIPDYY